MDLSKFTLEELRAACTKREAELSSSTKVAKFAPLDAIRLKRAALFGEMADAEKALNDANTVVVHCSRALNAIRSRIKQLGEDLERACHFHDTVMATGLCRTCGCNHITFRG
jgi:hypothetical protein